MSSSEIIPARLLLRFVAYLIDLIVVTATVDIIALLLPDEQLLVSAVFLVIQSCYHALSEGSVLQSSPGQWLLNMHIVRTKDKVITVGFALDRYLLQVLPVVLLMIFKVLLADILDLLWLWMFLLYMINFSMCAWYGLAFFNRERKTLHDKLLGTVVVNGRKVSLPKR